MKRQYRVWMLTDNKGNVIIKGRKKNVELVAYQRYVYSHIYTDCLYQTDEWC